MIIWVENWHITWYFQLSHTYLLNYWKFKERKDRSRSKDRAKKPRRSRSRERGVGDDPTSSTKKPRSRSRDRASRKLEELAADTKNGTANQAVNVVE